MSHLSKSLLMTDLCVAEEECTLLTSLNLMFQPAKANVSLARLWFQNTHKIQRWLVATWAYYCLKPRTDKIVYRFFQWPFQWGRVCRCHLFTIDFLHLKTWWTIGIIVINWIFVVIWTFVIVVYKNLANLLKLLIRHEGDFSFY